MNKANKSEAQKSQKSQETKNLVQSSTPTTSSPIEHLNRHENSNLKYDQDEEKSQIEPMSQKASQKNGRDLSMDQSIDKSSKKGRKPKGSQDIPNDDTMERSVKKPNRDHCNECKDGGELLCCDNCVRSFHIKCCGLKIVPDEDWYCKICVPIVEKRKQLEDEKRKKAQEREQQLEEKRIQREKEYKLKEQEIEKKREEKRLEKQRQEEEKQRQREQKLKELLELKAKRQEEQQQKELQLKQQQLQQQQQQSNASSQQQQLSVKEGKAENSHDSKGISPNRSKMNGQETPNDLSASVNIKKKIPSTGNGLTNGASSNQKKSDEKSEAERAKEAKMREYRNQLKIFSNIYPEQVEKNQIKYPIEDKLIKKMPLLHGADTFPEKPQLKQVLIDGASFERLLYIWEFLNNFGDFMNLQNFKFEELQVALSFNQQPDQVQLYSQQDLEDQEPDWEEQINNKTVSEQGFGLINSIHVAIVNVFMNELKHQEEKLKASNEANNKENVDEEEDILIEEVRKNFDKPELIWPELIRLILKSQKKFDFYPLDPHITSICDRLASCTPETYSSKLSYIDKAELLECLIDGIHDLDDFRIFLNQRVEEKSSYNKQKMDLYGEIKQLENQKQELIKEHANNNFFNNSEEILNKIEDLKKQLGQANRIQSKNIHQQIQELQSEKNKIMKEMQKIEDQIEKRQMRIEKLNEQAHKTSIKTSMLGKDAEKNEYWFFKEEPGKLFVKKYEEIRRSKLVEVKIIDLVEERKEENVIQQDQAMIDEEEEQVDIIFKWFYYDLEDEFEKLIEACNIKGQRERKLQENLRKIRDRVKLRKSKKQAAQPPQPAGSSVLGIQNDQQLQQKQQEKQEDSSIIQLNDQEKKEEQDAEMEEESQQEVAQNKHALFENDNYYQALTNAIWFNKKMPTKRQVMMENKAIMVRQGRGGVQKQAQQPRDEEKVTFESLRNNILSIEELYTDSSLQFQREWDHKIVRDKIKEQIVMAQTVDDLQQLLLRLDQGFSSPHILKYVNKENQNESDDDQNQQDSQQESDDQKMDNEESKMMNGEGQDFDKNVRRIKSKFLKFWPSKELRDAWRQYVFQECQDGNVNALYIAVRILEKINGQFLQKQLDGLYKKQKKEQKINQNKGQKPQQVSNQAEKMQSRKNKSYKQFFEDEESGSEDERSNDRSRRSAKPQGPGRGRGKKRVEESEDESQDEKIDNSDEEDEEEEDSREWDDACYVCMKGGNVLCCETCSHVAHLQCANLKKSPQGEWHCEECLIKQTQRRTTRGQSNLYVKPKNGYRR